MKITIAQAADKLAENGMRLIRVLPYGLATMTARYEVEADGRVVEMTSREIMAAIA